MVVEFLLAGAVSTAITGKLIEMSREATTKKHQRLVEQAGGHLTAGKHKAALSVLDELAKLNPDFFPETVALRGLCYMGLVQTENITKNLKKAIACFETLLSAEKSIYIPSAVLDVVQTKLAEARTLIDSLDKMVDEGGTIDGSKAKARAYYERMILKRNPKAVDELINKMNSAMDAERYEQAINHIDELIKLDPSNGDHYYVRSLCRLILGDVVKAAEDCREALKHELLDIHRKSCEDKVKRVFVLPPLHEKAKAAHNAGHFKEAIKLLDELIKLDPENGLHYRNRGDCKQRVGDVSDAIRDYRAALKRELPDDLRQNIGATIKSLSEEIRGI